MELLEKTQELVPIIRALCRIAHSNFPGSTDITISCSGASNAVIHIPDYVLLNLLPEENK